MLSTRHSTARPGGQQTATSLAKELVEYLGPKTQSRVHTADRTERDCSCSDPWVEIVVFSEMGHTHVEIHFSCARQTVFLHTIGRSIIEHVKDWCDQQGLDYREKRV